MTRHIKPSSLDNSAEEYLTPLDIGVEPKKTLTKYQLSTLRRAARIHESFVRDSDVLSSPHHVREMIKCHVSHLEYEVLGVMFLDNRHRLESIEIMFRGCIDHAAVYPRQILQTALKNNSAALVLFHNHPSGVAEPSDADIRLTRKIVDACSICDIRVIDHIIAGGPNYTSLAERGLM